VFCVVSNILPKEILFRICIFSSFFPSPNLSPFNCSTVSKCYLPLWSLLPLFHCWVPWLYHTLTLVSNSNFKFLFSLVLLCLEASKCYSWLIWTTFSSFWKYFAYQDFLLMIITMKSLLPCLSPISSSGWFLSHTHQVLSISFI